MTRFTPRRLVERGDLSVPRGAAPMGARYDADAFGRMSEAIARFLGTGRFLAGQTVLVIGWITLNTVAVAHHWDPYPFILLNLAFSTQAAYTGPVLLLAGNRQAQKDRLTLEHAAMEADKADHQNVEILEGIAQVTKASDVAMLSPIVLRRTAW